ncbi:MAG: prephenate dehydratase [Endomicrobiia bacterium]
MNKLNLLRKKINIVDEKLLHLLNQRAVLSKQIGEIKKNYGNDIYSPGREKVVINRILSLNKGPIKNDDLKEIFLEIIQICRLQQKVLSVAYLGPQATFTHLAAIKIFGSGNNFVPKETIYDVFNDIEKNIIEFGVVPVENTTEGVVTHTLDMFLETNLYICGELNMKISHCLVSKEKKIDNIKVIYSHPQAIAQCRNYLYKKLKNVRIVEVSSTAQAAKIVSEKRISKSAAISSEISAKIYNLNILAKKIEDSEENYTRFIVIGKHSSEYSGSDKTSIAFTVKDRIGILHDALAPFKKYKINLTKIESRPNKKRPWEYIFFVDLIGHIKDKKVACAIKELTNLCAYYKFLGSYPSAK